MIGFYAGPLLFAVVAVGAIVVLVVLYWKGPTRSVRIAVLAEIGLALLLLFPLAGGARGARKLATIVTFAVVATIGGFASWRMPARTVLLPLREVLHPWDERADVTQRIEEAAAADLEWVADREVAWRYLGMPQLTSIRFFLARGRRAWIELVRPRSRSELVSVSVLSFLDTGDLLRTCVAVSDAELLPAKGTRVRRVASRTTVGGLLAEHDAEIARLGATAEIVTDPLVAHVVAGDRWIAELLAAGRVAPSGENHLRVTASAMPGLVGRAAFLWFG